MKRMQYCFNCGKELGVYDSFSGYYDTCGAKECELESLEQRNMDREEWRYRAEEDDYERYF